MRIARKLITSIFIASFVGGCSTSGDKLVVSESDPAIKQLLSVAEDIAAHERQLYEIESARYIEVNKDKIGSFDMHFIPSLEKYYPLGDQWVGPLEPLIQDITELAGLNKPRYLNVKSNPIIVYVDTKRRKLIEILADGGNQARQQAIVTLKVRERLIQVEYAND